MANTNLSTPSSALQAANAAFVDLSDLLLGADALVAMHDDADGETLSAVRNIIRLARDAADEAGNAADQGDIAIRRSTVV